MSYPSNTNTSASGGYLLPAPPSALPGDLSLEEFLQTVLVGVSGLCGDLVRQKWQPNPPKQPDIYTNWLTFGLTEDDSDTFAYYGLDSNNVNSFMRMESLSLQCSFYGPLSLSFGKIVRDGLQFGQNREALQSVKMDFVACSKLVRAPDLVNERWVDRWEMTINLRREIVRTYPILYFLSASGTLMALGDTGLRTLPIAVQEA